MKKLLFLVLFSISLFAGVQETLYTVYNEASKYKAKDGHVFNDTMTQICLTETSGGFQIIGDSFYKTGKEKHLFNKSIGINQVKLSTAITVLRRFDLGHKNLLHKDPFAYKKYIPIFNKIRFLQDKILEIKKSHKGMKEKELEYVERKLVLLYKKVEPYKEYYLKDERIVSLLMSDIRFNTMIATNYLIMNYEYAQRKKMWNPYFKTISRYNGGWKNTSYFKKVMSKRELWKRYKIKLKQKGKL